MNKVIITPDENILREIRGSKKDVQVLQVIVQRLRFNLEAVIDIKRFSDFRRLLRMTVLCLCFVRNLRIKAKGLKVEILKGEITADEFSEVECMWIHEVQSKTLTCQEDENIKQLEHQLGLFVDENNIVHCKGRLSNAELPYSTKFPVLILRDHYLAQLLILDSHQRVHHQGVKATLTDLRARFWIPRGRQLVRRILYHCTTCRRYESRHYAVPLQADLPRFRVIFNPAWDSVGVDYAGPLFVKWSIQNESTKVYVVLYSCCSSRAIHLELVQNMSTDSFINCFRLISRKGLPRLVISDNAKQFYTVDNILKYIFDQSRVQQFLANHNILWHFNIEKAPWQGGFYKHMVKSVKRCLRKTLRNANLSFEELMTILTEIESTINSRPFVRSFNLRKTIVQLTGCEQ